jgi:hypothetical protein
MSERADPCDVAGCPWSQGGECRIAVVPELGGFGRASLRDHCGLTRLLRRVFPGCRLAARLGGLVVDVDPPGRLRPLLWFDDRRRVWLGRLR